MKFTCNTETLYEACTYVSRAISTKSNMPVIEGVYFKTTEQGLLLTGYDFDIGIFTTIDAHITEPGEAILNSKLCCEILKALPEQKVTVSVDEHYKFTIESGVSNYCIKGLPADEYPEMPYVNGTNDVLIDQNMFKNMVRQTIFAVSTDNTRVAHRGIKFNITAGQLEMVAIDGFRVAIRREKIDFGGENMSFIVPAKSLSEIVKFVTDGEGYISMRRDKRNIVFGINGYNIVSRLLEGDFIDYTRVIPQDHLTQVRFSSREMLDTLSRIYVISNDKVKRGARFFFSGGECNISATSEEIGSVATKMNLDVSGEDCEIGLNGNFLADAVRAAESDEIIMRLKGSFTPAVIVPLEGDSFYYLILPVRL